MLRQAPKYLIVTADDFGLHESVNEAVEQANRAQTLNAASLMVTAPATDDAQVDGHINSISARITGHVVRLNVLDNQYVEAGAVLVEIDPADYKVAYDRAKAEFEDAQAAGLQELFDAPGVHPVVDHRHVGARTNPQRRQAKQADHRDKRQPVPPSDEQ